VIHLIVCFDVNPLNAELNPICQLLALLGGATIVVVSRLRVKDESAKFWLRSITHHVINAYGETEVKLYTFTVSAPDGDEFNTRSLLETSERTRNSGLCQEWNPIS